jgi:transposase
MQESLSRLAEQLDNAREREMDILDRLKRTVIAARAAGMPTSQIIAESGLARRTVYRWIGQENR